MKANLMIAGALLVAGSFASANIRLKKDDVFPVTLDQDVRMRTAKEGSRVVALAERHPDLPDGAVFLGEIVRVERGEKAGNVEIRFTSIRMPAGNQVRIDAVPIPLNQAVRKNGRWVAQRGRTKPGDAVLGGALGGLILGSLIKKPFEGAVIGTLAGIVIAETSKANDGDLVAPRGTKMGALLLSDVEMDEDYRERERIRYDDRREGREDERQIETERRSTGWPGQETRQEDRREYDRQPAFEIDGREVKVGREERPYQRDGVWMVPLVATAKHLRYELDATDNRYYLESPDGSLRIDLGSDEARVNGKSVRLAARAEKRNRIVFVPVQVIEALDPESKIRF